MHGTHLQPLLSFLDLQHWTTKFYLHNHQSEIKKSEDTDLCTNCVWRDIHWIISECWYSHSEWFAKGLAVIYGHSTWYWAIVSPILDELFAIHILEFMNWWQSYWSGKWIVFHKLVSLAVVALCKDSASAVSQEFFLRVVFIMSYNGRTHRSVGWCESDMCRVTCVNGYLKSLS